MYALYAETHIHRLMEHRWSEHLKTTSSIIKNYEEICRLLQSISAGTVIRDGDTIVDTRGLLSVVQAKSFCFNAVLAKLTLNLFKFTISCRQSFASLGV